jgi:hypothetical protein
MTARYDSVAGVGRSPPRPQVAVAVGGDRKAPVVSLLDEPLAASQLGLRPGVAKVPAGRGCPPYRLQRTPQCGEPLLSVSRVPLLVKMCQQGAPPYTVVSRIGIRTSRCDATCSASS